MIKNYLISHLRSLWRNRSHAFINLFGLSLGITCSVIIFLILRFEMSFDAYHPGGERVYRVVTEYTKTEDHGYSAGITYPLPVALRQDFPDIAELTITDSNMSDPVISIHHDDGTVDRFKEGRVTFADADYFRMFHYEWVSGNNEALKREKTVVLTESVAKKYFGNESALNKVINFNNEFDVTVTGVVKDPPSNTDLPFRIILSANLGANKRGWDDWGATSSSINCYVRLSEGQTAEDFNAKLKGWHLKYFTGRNEEDGKYRNYFLQPLSEVHFDTRFGNYGGRVVSYSSLVTLSLIGVLLLLTACINFINLNTVLIIDRAKEAGVRKVMGSSRAQLVFQFLGETFTITWVSMLISGGLVELALIGLQPVLGYRLAFEPFSDPGTMLFLIGLPFLVTLLAGLYPAISLSRFQPVEALKARISGTPGQGLTLRRALIVFQLVISQVLVVCTIIIVQQLDHFMSQPLGINSNAVIEFELPENEPELIHRLSERLKQIPGVLNVTMSNTGSTSDNQWGGDFEATVAGKIVKENTSVKFADEDYITTYQIPLLYGEDLVKSDTATRFLVNESFTRTLGFQDPRDALGTPVNIWDRKALITGIVKDFNTMSLHSSLRPTIILAGTRAFFIGATRLSSENTQETIAKIKSAWEDIYPKYVFEHWFLDEAIANFYKTERRNSYLIGLFAAVAIFIGCIGLFGLVSFMARRKTKEVGIRKTLGASVGQVVALFSKEFAVLIVIAFVISGPLAYYFMEEWLRNFAYRIHPGVMTFLTGMTLTLIVVLLTVGIKSYKAAVANPVAALRDE